MPGRKISTPQNGTVTGSINVCSLHDGTFHEISAMLFVAITYPQKNVTLAAQACMALELANSAARLITATSSSVRPPPETNSPATGSGAGSIYVPGMIKGNLNLERLRLTTSTLSSTATLESGVSTARRSVPLTAHGSVLPISTKISPYRAVLYALRTLCL